MAAIATLEAWKDELAEKIKALKSDNNIKPGSVLELRLQYLEADFERCQKLIEHQRGLITDTELQEHTSWHNELSYATETECSPDAGFLPSES